MRKWQALNAHYRGLKAVTMIQIELCFHLRAMPLIGSSPAAFAMLPEYLNETQRRLCSPSSQRRRLHSRGIPWVAAEKIPWNSTWSQKLIYGSTQLIALCVFHDNKACAGSCYFQGMQLSPFLGQTTASQNPDCFAPGMNRKRRLDVEPCLLRTLRTTCSTMARDHGCLIHPGRRM